MKRSVQSVRWAARALARVLAAGLIAAAAIASGVWATDSGRPAPGRHLLGNELFEVLADTTHFGYSTWGSDRWIEYYGPDGTAVYKHGRKTVFGIWETTFDSICFTYDDGDEEQRTHIFRVYRDGEKFYFVAADENGDDAVVNIADRTESGRSADLQQPSRHGRSVKELRRNLACFPGQDT